MEFQVRCHAVTKEPLLFLTTTKQETKNQTVQKWMPFNQQTLQYANDQKIPCTPNVLLGLLKQPKLPIHLDRIPASLWTRLYPYQQEGVTWLLQRHSAILGDEMGLGKTYQAIGVILALRIPTVIICPAALRFSWKTHLEEFEPVNVIQHWADEISESGITVLSYGILNSPKFKPKLQAFKPGLLVLDESHRCKHQTSQRTKFMLKWVRSAKPRVIAISGTPLNRPSELFPQLKLVAPRVFQHFMPWQDRQKPNVFYFALRYCNPIKQYIGYRKHVWNTSGNARLEELHAILQPLLLRRLKKNVTSLPSKIRQKVIIGENKANQQFRDTLKNLTEKREEKGKYWADKQFMDIVRDTSKAKVKLLQGYLKEVVLPELQDQPDLKILLFGHHHHVLDGIQTCFPAEMLIRIDGKVPFARRNTLVEEFQTNSQKRVALLGINATGVGLTLTAARLVIFLELCFSPEEHLQAEDRAHRIGQNEKVVVRYLTVKNTTDDLLWATIVKKVKTTTTTLNGQHEMLSATTQRFKRQKTNPPEESS